MKGYYYYWVAIIVLVILILKTCKERFSLGAYEGFQDDDDDNIFDDGDDDDKVNILQKPTTTSVTDITQTELLDRIKQVVNRGKDVPPAPKEPGCYVYQPLGCQKNNYMNANGKWARDEWAEKNNNAAFDKIKCLERAKVFNTWCDIKDTQMAFVPGKQKQLEELKKREEEHNKTLNENVGKLNLNETQKAQVMSLFKEMQKKKSGDI